MISLSAPDLDAFVAESDRLGGPGTEACDAYWDGFTYHPTHRVDQTLNPFSDAYVEEQLALYAELSGRSFDQVANEQLLFEIQPYVDAINPYNHPDPSVLALHIERLSKALRLAGTRRGERLLDMGCGWGLSSEIAAYSGMKVTAIDINPCFVELVNTRAARSGWDIVAALGTFDDYVPAEAVDMVLFYECLHHALRPWTVIDRLANRLKTNGRIVLAGEPVNAVWWTHWGMRLDALSIYCIRKYGWFESGWSLDFIRSAFHRAGLKMQAFEDSDSQIGYTLIARANRIETLSGADFLASNVTVGFTSEADNGIMGSRSSIDLAFPNGAQRVQITLANHRTTPLNLKAWTAKDTWLDTQVPPGTTQIVIPASNEILRLELEAETWVPEVEIGNGDVRHLSLHLTEVSFY